jgi:hypothetical protein
MNNNEDWLKLDNAAKIYPAVSSRKSPAQFRLSATLDSAINYNNLNLAWEKMINRCPYFQVYLRRGFFWYYLQRHNNLPAVELMDPLPVSPFQHNRKTSHLIKISIRDQTISLDFSHIITDGNGGLRFLLALLNEYFKLSGVSIAEIDDIPSTTERINPEEFEDGYRRYFPGKLPKPEPLAKAYHLKGKPFLTEKMRLITGKVSLPEILELSRKYQVSTTEYLAAVYLFSLMQIRQQDSKSRKEESILRLEIPVNMRKVYPSRTMRNFSLFTSIDIDLKLGNYTFSDILKKTHHSLQIQKDGKELSRQVSRNVRGELNPVVRIIPLFLKDLYLAQLYSKLGEKCYSGVLSNLGQIVIPERAQSRIRSFNFVLVPNNVMKKSITMLSYQDEMSINISSVIESRELERLFFTKLVEDGISVAVKEI